jgi:exosortase A
VLNAMTIFRPDRKLLFSVAGLMLLIYLPVLSDLIERWANDSNYSHGFLVPLISGFLIWRQREELAACQRSSTWVGWAMILFGMLIFVIGNAGSEYFTVRVSLVITLFGLVLYLFGKEITRRVWFAIFLLLFMIPVPAVVYFSITFPMQLLASKVAVFAMDVLGIPVARQGNIIHLPNTSLEVAEACSGLRSLISLLAMGAIYAYLSQRRFWAQAVLFVSTIPLAIVGNMSRVFVTALIAYAWDFDTTAEPLHTIMGAMVFVIAFIGLLVCGAILRRITG